MRVSFGVILEALPVVSGVELNPKTIASLSRRGRSDAESDVSGGGAD